MLAYIYNLHKPMFIYIYMNKELELEITINNECDDNNAWKDKDVQEFVISRVNLVNDCKKLMNTVEENGLNKSVIEKIYEHKFTNYQKLVYDVVAENWDKIAENNNGVHPSEEPQYNGNGNEKFVIKNSPFADYCVEIKDYGMMEWIITDPYILWYIKDSFMCAAIRHNHIDVIEWLRDPDTTDGPYPWTPHELTEAVKHENLDIIKWLRNPNTGGGVCEWDYNTFTVAAQKGNFEIMEWLRNPDVGGGSCPWSSLATAVVASEGNINVLEWLQDPNKGNGICPYDHNACTFAAQTCQLDAFKWLRDPNTGAGSCNMFRGTRVVKEYYDYKDDHGNILIY